jgi:ABC-2 type transport system ATP-binding protein
MDEPASGLDPRARIEIRELLKELKKMGKTILISSHILHELAELCNTVGIIEKGELLFNGTVDEILRRAKVGHVVHVGVAERLEDAAKVLQTMPGIEKVAIVQGDGTASGGGSGRLIHAQFDDRMGGNYTDIPNVLINNGLRMTHFQEEPVNLETAFMRLTKGLVQ